MLSPPCLPQSPPRQCLDKNYAQLSPEWPGPNWIALSHPPFKSQRWLPRVPVYCGPPTGCSLGSHMIKAHASTSDTPQPISDEWQSRGRRNPIPPRFFRFSTATADEARPDLSLVAKSLAIRSDFTIYLPPLPCPGWCPPNRPFSGILLESLLRLFSQSFGSMGLVFWVCPDILGTPKRCKFLRKSYLPLS